MLIGITRFSVFLPNNKTAWRLNDGSNIDEYRKKLFAPDRLNTRLKIFKDWSLPALNLISKQCPDYVHILHYSKYLPDNIKNEIIATKLKYPFLLLNEINEDGTGEINNMDTILNKRYGHLLNKIIPFAWFRLDDDDIIPHNFYQRIRSYISLAFVGHSVSLGKGLTATFQNNHLYNFREEELRFNSVGLMYVCAYLTKIKQRYVPDSGSHTTTDRHAPGIVDSSELGFLRILHPNQDSDQQESSPDLSKPILLHNWSASRPFFFNMETVSQYFPSVETHYKNSVATFPIVMDLPCTCRISEMGLYELVYEMKNSNPSILSKSHEKKRELKFQFSSHTNNEISEDLFLNKVDGKTYIKNLHVTTSTFCNSFLFKIPAGCVLENISFFDNSESKSELINLSIYKIDK
jgi:hypothetical protein